MSGTKHPNLFDGDGDASGPSDRPGRVLAFVLHHALWVVVAVTMVTAIAGYLAAGLPLVTDFAQLIPGHSRSVTEQRRADRYLGNTSQMVVVIDAPETVPPSAPADDADAEPSPSAAPAPDPRAELTREAATLLAERLATDDAFAQVLFKFDVDFFETHGLLYLSAPQLEDLRDRLDRRINAEVMKANPLFVDLDDEDGAGAELPADEPDIFDPDTLRELYGGGEAAHYDLQEYLRNDTGHTYLVLAQPTRPAVDMNYNRDILARTQAHVDALRLTERFGVTVTLAGNYRSALEENQAVRRDLGMAGLVSLGLLLILIAAYFRRLWAVVIIFVPLLSGVVIMMGYVRLAVGRLNTITGFCFALFMGLSIDFAIHMLARYDEERGRGNSVFRALRLAYGETARAALAAGLTTAVGFLSLIAADFKGLHEFGIIAGGGIVICLGVIAVEFPAVIALGLRFSKERGLAVFSVHRDPTRRGLPPGAKALIGLAILAGLALIAPRVGWEDDFRELRGGSSEAMSAVGRASEILGRSTQPSVRITEGLDDARRLTDACNAERARRGDATTVQMCVSMADFVPLDQEAKLERIAEIAALLTDNRLESLDDEPRERLTRLRNEAPTQPITVDDLPAEIRSNFVNSDGIHFYVKAYPLVTTWLVSANIRFAEELYAIDGASDRDIGPIGTSTIMADLMRVMQRDSVLVGSIALIAVFLILLLLFRSLPRALSSYVPLLAGLLATAGLMVLLDMKLGFFNMIVIPSLIGIGIDSNIHLVHRYHTEGRGSWWHVVHTTGSGCVMAAATTMAGFAGLLIAGHQGLRSIGTLAVLGITTCTLVSLTVVPACFEWMERRTKGAAFGLMPTHAARPEDRG